MIIITGAAGFIGSCMVGKFNQAGRKDLVLVDDFSRVDKVRNWEAKEYAEKVDRALFFEWLKGQSQIDYVIHLGARTDTAEQDRALFAELNLGYSQKIWEWCTEHQVPLIYASSAATYGDGNLGFLDDHGIVEQLKPLNPYGESKNDFDKWVLKQSRQPPRWAGLKFFNVFGPNEYHKGRMASVVFHAFNQIQATGKMRLFRSHRDGIADGEQSRDFIYVMDVVRVIEFLMGEGKNGLYNLGSGQARSFLDLVKAVFAALGREPQIEFIDTPADIRETYQYFTQAEMGKLRNAGWKEAFTPLEAGILEYVDNYLKGNLVY